MAAVPKPAVSLALFLLVAMCARCSAGRPVTILKATDPAESSVHHLITQVDSSSTKQSTRHMDLESLHSFLGSSIPEVRKPPPVGGSPDCYDPPRAVVDVQRSEDLKETEMKALVGSSKPKGSKTPPKGASPDPNYPPAAFVRGQRSEDLKETDMKALLGSSKPKGSKTPPKGASPDPNIPPAAFVKRSSILGV